MKKACADNGPWTKGGEPQAPECVGFRPDDQLLVFVIPAILDIKVIFQGAGLRTGMIA